MNIPLKKFYDFKFTTTSHNEGVDIQELLLVNGYTLKYGTSINVVYSNSHKSFWVYKGGIYKFSNFAEFTCSPLGELNVYEIREFFKMKWLQTSLNNIKCKQPEIEVHLL